NRDTVNLNTTITFAKSSGTIINQNSFNFAALFSLTHATSATFYTLSLHDALPISITSGTFTVNAGTISGGLSISSGTLNLSGGTISRAPGRSPGTVKVTVGTLDGTTDLYNSTLNNTVSGGTFRMQSNSTLVGNVLA